jgi:DNA (cytosine-5)-methyltransferase 1
MKQARLYEYLPKKLRRDESVLDLYAGAGGLGTGFMNYFLVTVAVDHERDAYLTYRMNHKECDVRLMDVMTYINSCTPKDFEILIGVVGGPPCQDFSVLNKSRNPRSCRADELGNMVVAVLTVKPEFALIENVKSVPKWYKLKVVQTLERGGYNVVSRVVQAYDYGSVQKRPRWIVTACKTKHVYPEPLPSGRTAKEVLLDTTCKMRITPRVLKAIQTLPSGKWVSLPKSNYKVYFVVDPDKPLPAVVNPTKLRYIHPNRQRYLSMREMALAQGFPKSYKFHGTLSSVGQQLANAFPVEMAEAFAYEFALQLQRSKVA